ncbi:hypothetical protein L218DRAFT_965548 [Marasmius fiardii PR-910]|nr:hypothetical protein L218DRAFT_965548 [Marasmius fiardii PR-910]
MHPSQNWSSTIKRLLVDYAIAGPSFDSTTSYGNPSRPAGYLARSSRHPHGTIWREFVAKCVFFDLMKGISVPRRRIARMYEAGLGAIVMYEIPRSETPGAKDSAPLCWNVENVFGCPDDSLKLGMGQEEFLDKIQVQLAYTPSYACTSFVSGQVMNALVQTYDTKADIQPIPAPGGFGFAIAAKSFTAFDNGLSRSPPVATDLAAKVLRVVPVSNCAPRFIEDRASWSEDDLDNDLNASEMEWVEMHLFDPEDEEDAIEGQFPTETFDEREDTSSPLDITTMLDQFNSLTYSASSISWSQPLSTSSSVDITTSLGCFMSKVESSLFAVRLPEPSTPFEADIGDVSICTLISDLESSSSLSSLYLGPLTPSKGCNQRSDLADVAPLLHDPSIRCGDCDRFVPSLPMSDCFAIKPLNLMKTSLATIADEDFFFPIHPKGDEVGHQGRPQPHHILGKGKENIPPGGERM